MNSSVEINLLVLRTETPELLKQQYEHLGFEFEHHQHGKGPMHFASENGGFVLEIYPLTRSMNKADGSLRLGFSIENFELKMQDLAQTTWNILSQPKETTWGMTALVQDLDGRKIELKEK